MAAQVFRNIYGHYDKPEGTELSTIPKETTPYERLVKTFTPK